MKTELIASYSEYDRAGHTWEDFYSYEVDCNEYEGTLEQFKADYTDEDFYSWDENMWEHTWEDAFDYVCEEADKVIGTLDYVSVDGIANRWNGAREVDTHVQELELVDIIKTYINVDTLEIDVYTDRVEVRNIHHDGTNYYTLTPFSFCQKTKAQLLDLIDKDEFEWYGDKLYKAKKQDLIDHLEENWSW